MCIRPPKPHASSPLSSSDGSQLPPQSSRLSHFHRLGAAPCWKERRMHHLLRPGGGHCHLHLWTHVSVQRLRPQAEKTDQRVLSDMQEAHQRCNQNISAVMVPDVETGAVTSTAGCHLCPPSQARLDTDLDWRLAKTGHNCAYIYILYGWIEMRLFIRRTVMILIQRLHRDCFYILAKTEEMNYVLPFFVFSMWCLLCHMYFPSRKSLLWIFRLYPRSPRL